MGTHQRSEAQIKAMNHRGSADDDSVWATRVVAHGSDLLRFARSFTPSVAEAEDLVQETLLRAFRSRETFRGESSELSWLRRILRNLAIDRARRPLREISMDHVDADWRDDSFTIDTAAVLDLIETRDELLDALARLSFDYRSMIVLHDVEGWTVQAIAEELEIGLPAAKQRLRRARMAMVSALAESATTRIEQQGVPMRCWDARRHVSEYLDDSLDAELRSAVEAHLRSCPTCPNLVAALVGTTNALSRHRDPDAVLSPALIHRLDAQAEQFATHPVAGLKTPPV